MIVETHSFKKQDLIGGSLALDFVNTVTGRDVAPREWIDGYPRLIEWARLCGAFDANDLDALDVAAARDATGAKAALARALRLREALHRVFSQLLDGTGVHTSDRTDVERAYQSAMRSVCFQWGNAGCRLVWTSQSSGLDLIGHVVANAAISLLTHVDTARLRVCAGVNCGWLFLDSSRNGRRRWCDMATCGNVAKARRHYRRQLRS